MLEILLSICTGAAGGVLARSGETFKGMLGPAESGPPPIEVSRHFLGHDASAILGALRSNAV